MTSESSQRRTRRPGRLRRRRSRSPTARRRSRSRRLVHQSSVSVRVDRRRRPWARLPSSLMSATADDVDAEEREAGFDQDAGDGLLVFGADERARQRGDRGQPAGRPSGARTRCRGPQAEVARRLDGSGETASVSQTWNHWAVWMIGRASRPRHWTPRDRETAIHLAKMGLSAYSQALGSPLASSHWAMRTAAVRTWPRRPR